MALFLPAISNPVNANSLSSRTCSFQSIKHSKYFIFCLLLFKVGVGSVYGVTKTALSSGNWSSTTTWGGAAPTSNDDVVINNGISVTMDANPGNCNNLILNNNAYLTWTGSGTLNIAGNLTNNGWSGLLTPGNGTINFTGMSSAINGSSGSQTFNNIIVSKTAGQTLSYGGNVTGVNVNGDFTMSSGTFSPGVTLILTGNWNNNGGTFIPGTGTVTMNGSGKYIQGSASTTFYCLTIGTGNSATILLGIDQTTVNGTLTLTNGLLTLGAYNLILGASAPAVSAGSFYSANMIVANGTGQVRKQFNSAGSYTFPIGDSSSNYSPITLNFASGAFAAGAYAGVNVTNAKHPQNTSPNNYLTRYWSVSQSGISTFSCTVSGNYVYGDDVVGQEGFSNVVEYAGHLPWVNYPTSIGSSTLVANGVTVFGDFTGMGLQTINTSVPSLDGFTYIHYYGPSDPPKTFNVTAQNLSNNVIVTAPADFLISTDYTNGYATSISLTPSNGIVNSTIYVRLKAGLIVGNYSNENIVCTTVGLNPVNVLLTNATVTAPISGTTPTGDNSRYSITLVKIGTINNVTAKPAGYNDYTATQSTDLVLGNTYQLTVNVNTNGNNTVGAKAWIDWNNAGFTWNSGFQTYDLGVATYTPDGKTAGCPINITVPLSANLGNIKMRVACLGGNTPYNVTDNSSEVEDYTLNIVAPTINVVATLNGFSYPLGTGPSSEKTFSVGGTYLSANLVVTPPTDYEISLTSGSSFVAINPILLTPTSKTVPTTTIYVRLKAGLPAGGYATENIVCASTGATSKNAVCSGTVVNNYTVITPTPGILNGFSCNYGGAPSAEQTFTVSGVNLSTNLIVTAPLDYELSSTSGGAFVATNSISLIPSSGTVSTTTIYVRLKAGLAVGNYNESITFMSTNAPTQSIPVSGIVSIRLISTYYSIASGNWNMNTTWSYTSGGLSVPSGVYPQSGDIVNIEKGYTVLSNADAACASLNFSNATSQLVISPAVGLNVSGTITTQNSNQIYIQSGSGPTVANGSLIFHNALNQPVNASVEMYSKAFCLSPLTTPKTGYKWEYFGIPVRSVAGSPAFDGSYVRRWEETAQVLNTHWVKLDNASILTPFTGYEVTQDQAKTFVLQGQLVNKDTTFTMSLTTSPALYPGQHIYANPYTAAINIKKLNFVSGLDAVVYLYNTGSIGEWNVNPGNATQGNTSAGQYNSIPQNLAGDVLGLPSQIPSMQGFLVIANSNNAVFTIPYNAVEPNSTAQRTHAASNISDNVTTRIDVSGSHTSDRMWLYSQQGCTHHYDNGWDGIKMFGSALCPQIYAIEPDGNYQIDAVDDFNNTQIGFQSGADTNYTLTFTHQNLKNIYSGMFLTDVVESKTVDITESGSTYSFVAESSPTTVKRFIISTTDIEKDTPEAITQLKVYDSGNTVIVENLSKQVGEMFVYDLLGRNIKRATVHPNGVTTVQVDALSGTYVIKVSTGNERVSRRIMIVK